MATLRRFRIPALRLALALCCVGLLSACGFKGPLVLPEQQAALPIVVVCWA